MKEKPVNENIFVSPLSLHIALGMVANGAAGETRDEIVKVLEAQNLSKEDLNQSYRTLLEKLPNADPKTSLGLANSIWYKNSFAVEPDFIKTSKDYFNAQVTGLPFQPSDVNTINKWASDNTNGKIPKVIDKFDDGLVMLLMNALYFKGDWRAKFDKSKNQSKEFTKADGTKIPVQMMRLEDTVKYASNGNYTAVQKLYGSGQFSMTILLPQSGTIEEVFNQLNLQEWNALQGGLHTTKVALELPKFKLEQEFRLEQCLQTMGIQKAFTNVADFSMLSKAFTKISFVKQNTFGAVDEAGTEAAAVTTIGMILTAENPDAIPKFICDRPFGIIISENTSNTILFMGRITQPVSQ